MSVQVKGSGTIGGIDQGLDTVGVVTATSFVGTGVSVVGVVTATTFDGNLTGNVTGDITISDSIIHSGDTNTKIRFPEADAVTIETNGSERLRINSAGSWGIGANFGTSGQVLTSQGNSSAPTWATASSGLSHAQQWYLTANGSTPNGNTDYVLPTDNGTWQKHSASAAGVSAGTLGSDMTYDGSGVFAFPVTGIWKIEFQGWWGIASSDSDHYLRSRIQTTVNNSSWTNVQEQANSVKSDSTYTYQGFNVSYLFDVTSTTNCKVRFVLNPSGSNTYYKADGSPAKTGALFIRLGDT